jgi:hypothetical protein
LQALRHKVEGHEAHIDSLRDELERAQTQVNARQQLEEELRLTRDKSRETLENAEKIRREGVEAFEKAREAKQALELERAQLRRLHEEDKRAREKADQEARAEFDALRAELRDRAQRESSELRDAIESERARMYADLELERRTHKLAKIDTDATENRVHQYKQKAEESRRGIEKEVESYLSIERRPPQQSSPVDSAPAPVTPNPITPREPWQVSDEFKFAVWISIGVSAVAGIVASILFFKG